MITLKDIAKAVNTVIMTAVVGTKYNKTEITSDDISEGFKRPSVFVELENVKQSPRNAKVIETTLTVRIYYFPTDRIKHKIELLEMNEIIGNAFINSVKVNDNFIIPIEEVEFDVVDGVLQCSFELYYAQELDDSLIGDDKFEQMEVLELK